jgi:hypothetical protein
MNFDNYKFRCSSLGKLMTDPRSKSETLSETTKAYLLEIYIDEVYGRRKDISNKYTEKGLYCEEDSLGLASLYTGKLLLKNKDKFENEYICGTPDIILADKIIDIKTKWDIWGFAGEDGSNKDYYYQLQGYMWLCDKQNAELVYCLTNAPEHLIVSEKKKQMYIRGLVDMYETPEFAEMEKEIDMNMTFDDIESKDRVKTFSFTADMEVIEKLQKRILEAREYLNSIEKL